MGPAYDVGGAYILDQFPVNGGVAYSLRRLVSNYSGGAIRVRRTGDNLESDIGFTPNGHFNRNHLMSFVSQNGSVGGASGYIVKIYDQSGNGNDLIMNNTSNQPTIVDTGGIITEGGRVTPHYDGSDYLDAVSSFGFMENSSYSILVAEARTVNNNYMHFIGMTSTGNDQTLAFGYEVNNVLRFTQWANDLDGSVGAFTATTITLNTAILNTSTGRTVFRNGLALSSDSRTTSISTTASGGVVGGNVLGNSYFTGRIPEVLIFSYALTSNRAAIENNIKSYYGIP